MANAALTASSALDWAGTSSTARVGSPSAGRPRHRQRGRSRRSGTRVVPRTRLATRAACRAEASSGGDPGSAATPGPELGQRTGPGVLNTFQAQLARAGIPKMRLHDLRHGCASVLLAQGVPARVVMEVLGHSQISMTLDTYSHVGADLLGDAA